MMEHYVEVRNQELMDQLLRGNCARYIRLIVIKHGFQESCD